MASIVLPDGRRCLVDDNAYEAVRGIPWRAGADGYVVAYVCRGWYARLHRAILGVADGTLVDHINGDKLDNRKANLRACTHEENMRNRKRHKNNRSGFKGVYKDGRVLCGWRAQIRVNKRKLTLGVFPTPEVAHAAYCEAALKHHKHFARPQ